MKKIDIIRNYKNKAKENGLEVRVRVNGYKVSKHMTLREEDIEKINIYVEEVLTSKETDSRSWYSIKNKGYLNEKKELVWVRLMPI